MEVDLIKSLGVLSKLPFLTHPKHILMLVPSFDFIWVLSSRIEYEEDNAGLYVSSEFMWWKMKLMLDMMQVSTSEFLFYLSSEFTWQKMKKLRQHFMWVSSSNFVRVMSSALLGVLILVGRRQQHDESWKKDRKHIKRVYLSFYR